MTALAEILELPTDERIAIVEEIWDSIARDSINSDISDDMKGILDERLADLEANPEDSSDWETVFAEIQSRIR